MRDKKVIIDYATLLKKFLPVPSGKDEPSPEDYSAALNFDSVPMKGLESGVYSPLTAVLNGTPWLTEGYTAAATPSKHDPTDRTKQRIDLGMYLSDRKPKDADRTDWSKIELSIECKTEDVQHDPFDDQAPDLESGAKRRRENLGQIASYSALVFNKQHRTRHFTLILFASRARIVVCDSAGLLTTPLLNYREDPGLIARFLWRFCNASPENRGHDSSVVRLNDTDTDYAYMDEVAKKKVPMEDEHARAMFTASLVGTRWKVLMSGREFLVGSPNFVASGVIGRGTRGYVAVESPFSVAKRTEVEKEAELAEKERRDEAEADEVEADEVGAGADEAGAEADKAEADKVADKGKARPPAYQSPFVYLKDCWRVSLDGIEREGDILVALNKAKVHFIPTLVCQDDIEGQKTMTQKHAPHHSFKTHQHYRLVTKEVGMPLKTFATGYHLVGYITQCIVAHRDAYNAGYIHRDISDGNIFLYPTKIVVDDDGTSRLVYEAILADWEMAKRTGEQYDCIRQMEHTGTWPFMSVNSLSRRGKKILVEDEMESIFHLLVYICIRFLPSSVSKVPQFIHDYFDAYVDAGDWFMCGDRKRTAMIVGQILVGGSPLTILCGKASADATTTAAVAIADPHLGNTVPRSVVQGVQSTPSPPSALGTGASSADKHKLKEHPINAILKKLLQSIHAYYRLCHEDNPVDAFIPTVTVSPEDEEAVLPTGPQSDFIVLMGMLAPKATVTPLGENPSSSQEMTPELRKDLESRAALIQSHQSVLDLFFSALGGRRGISSIPPEWPRNDKIEDQLPKDWHPRGEGQTRTDTGRLTTGGTGQMEKPGSKRPAPPDDGEGHGKRPPPKRPRGDANTYESGPRSGASSRAPSGAPPG